MKQSISALFSLVWALVTVLSAQAQVTMFTCEDFILQANAQASLERMPDDPYGLDPDGNGIACDDMVTGGDLAMRQEDDGAGIGPAQFEIVEQEFQQVARPRVVLRITVEEASDEETAAALATAIAEGLDDEPDALVAHVFAYGEGDDTDGGYSVGIAQGSRDGLGWTGDGQLGLQFDAKDERGTVTVLLDSAISDVEERRLTVPLVLDGQGSLSEPEVALEQPAAVSVEEAAYATGVGEQMILLGESMGTFSDLMAAPRLGQDDWTVQLAGVILTWQSAYDDALTMTPPPTLAEVHDSYLQALSYLNLAGDDIVAGLDTFDVELLNRAAANLELANSELTVTQALINDILAKRGIDQGP